MNMCSLEMEINFHMAAFKGFGRRIICKCVCVYFGRVFCVSVRESVHNSAHCVWAFICLFCAETEQVDADACGFRRASLCGCL